ncbi:MAG: SRPBCC family protein [Nitrososphaeraceae archaeon]
MINEHNDIDNDDFNKGVISREIIINASIDDVFVAITDANKLTQWFPDIVNLEPKEGGKVEFQFLKEKSENLDKDYHVIGKIIKIIPNKELSYSWRHKDNPDFPDTVVSWKLEQLDKSKTRVILTHRGFTDKDKQEYENHSQGWSWFLTRLYNFVTKGES